MHENEESPISKLLQMRRHQQPPPEYFENFLREFQERQRSELLRRPAWRIALERLQMRMSESYQAVFGPFSVAHVSYAGASAAVLAIAAVFTTNMLQHPGGPQLAAIGSSQGMDFEIPHHLQNPVLIPRQAAPVSFDTLANFSSQRSFDLLQNTPRQGQLVYELTPEQVLALQDARRAAAQPSTPTTPTRKHPHYILDARPATYEPPASF